MKKIITVIFLCLLFILPSKALAAKSPTPRITEITGINTENVRAHFEIKPVKAAEIVKVKYKLGTRKFDDVKYKIPKNAKRSGTVNAAASATGSAIDLRGLPYNGTKFIYEIKVKVRVPGKSWSNWSSIHSF